MLTEGKTRGGMSPKKNKGVRRPISGPPATRPDRNELTLVVKSFRCSCGGRFSELVKPDQAKIGCRYCKGIAKEYKTDHAPPIWESVEKVVAKCPKCKKEMDRPQDVDVRVMFDWHCIWCGHVC